MVSNTLLMCATSKLRRNHKEKNLCTWYSYPMSTLSIMRFSFSFAGTTPLYFAAQEGRLAAIGFLHEKLKCDISARSNDGRKPIHAACQCGHTHIVKVFIFSSKLYSFCKHSFLVPLHTLITMCLFLSSAASFCFSLSLVHCVPAEQPCHLWHCTWWCYNTSLCIV